MILLKEVWPCMQEYARYFAYLHLWRNPTNLIAYALYKNEYLLSLTHSSPPWRYAWVRLCVRALDTNHKDVSKNTKSIHASTHLSLSTIQPHIECIQKHLPALQTLWYSLQAPYPPVPPHHQSLRSMISGSHTKPHTLHNSRINATESLRQNPLIEPYWILHDHL